ncbi:MAG: ABC transporter ATP-binding protein [Microvirga sp.]|nr:ABC transporter ATP-binding protein [Microvirga sp.]
MNAQPDDILLEVRDLGVQFPSSRGPIRAVDGVSLRVGRGEAVGIVGESGSGKSMTALSLLGLVPKPGRIARGEILFDGLSLTHLDDAKIRALRVSDIAMIFQDAGSYLNPVMRIFDQIAEAIGERGSRRPDVRERVIAALRDVRIPEPERVAASYPHELSGGMQQRVMIAAVLIRRPNLIIADEPTTALDATVQHQILQFLAELRRTSEASLILISHDLAVVTQVCDRVYVMYAGQVVEEGAADAIFDHPRHPYTQALAAAILDPFEEEPVITALQGSPPDMADLPSGCRFAPRCAHVHARCVEEAPPMIPLGPGSGSRCWLHAAETEAAR